MCSPSKEYVPLNTYGFSLFLAKQPCNPTFYCHMCFNPFCAVHQSKAIVHQAPMGVACKPGQQLNLNSCCSGCMVNPLDGDSRDWKFKESSGVSSFVRDWPDR